MTINLSGKVQPEIQPTLACRIGVEGHIGWRDLSACKLTYEENGEEYVEVFVVKKRQLHVVTDQMVRAKQSMLEDETQVGGRLSGLRLSNFPV